jgi:N-acetylglucosaminyldiphosphoundecaprenol N-acetyl-beta-D-mannosaminyltransferase
MSHDPDTPYYLVGGVPISVTDMGGLIMTVRRWLSREQEQGAFICYRAVHGVICAQDDERVFKAHRDALLVVADGKPLALLGRLRGFAGIRQVSGIEATEVLCRAGVEYGWKHYFFGGAPGVADALARVLSEKIPGLCVVGTECPPFREQTEDEREQTRRRIRESGADIVWVGIGTPKQELWMEANAPSLPGVIAMGVGAAFDVHTGRVPRAPYVLRQMYLEWAYRLVREPRRLWQRYADNIPRFLWLVARQEISARRGKGAFSFYE